MKIGLAGFQGSGKGTLFELLTGTPPDPAKVQTGQVGVAIVPDERLERLAAIYQSRKITPARIELYDTPGLSRDRQEANPRRLSLLREAGALVHVVGVFSGADPLADARAFEDELLLADLQVLSDRIARLRKDVTKPRPDREALQEELATLEPLQAILEEGRPLRSAGLNDDQRKTVRSFGLLSLKPQLVVLNTSEPEIDSTVLEQLREEGLSAVVAAARLELELEALSEPERSEFAAAMGLEDSCRDRLLRALFELTDQLTFYTCGEKEAHAWLLPRGATALEAADTIHSDLARGFIRAEVISAEDLFRLGSEREVRAAGRQHLEGKDYIVQDGDIIVIRFSV